MSSSEGSITEYNAGGDLALALAGVGQSKCGCQCAKRIVHAHLDGEQLDAKLSADKIRELIRQHSDSQTQYQGIINAAKIGDKDKKIDTKQLAKVVNIFHNVLGKKDFPNID